MQTQLSPGSDPMPSTPSTSTAVSSPMYYISPLGAPLTNPGQGRSLLKDLRRGHMVQNKMGIDKLLFLEICVGSNIICYEYAILFRLLIETYSSCHARDDRYGRTVATAVFRYTNTTEGCGVPNCKTNYHRHMLPLLTRHYGHRWCKSIRCWISTRAIGPCIHS